MCEVHGAKKGKRIGRGFILVGRGDLVIKLREILHPQYFYNKSQVVSCYWFKFETNTKITFLLQQ